MVIELKFVTTYIIFEEKRKIFTYFVDRIFFPS